MPRLKYLIFIDEVMMNNVFHGFNCTGLVVTEDEYLNKLKLGLSTLKDQTLSRFGGNNNTNLHFVPLVSSRAVEDTEKKLLPISRKEEAALWKGIIDLLSNYDYYILAGIVHDRNFKKVYPHHRTQLSLLSFSLLLENFTRFLHIVDGYGEVIVEQSSDMENLMEEYYRLKIVGNKCLTPQCFSHVLKGIKFYAKRDLIEGLQLVDFLANPLSRKIHESNMHCPPGFDKSPWDEILTNKIYKGPNNDQPYEFGVKKLFY